MKKNVQIVWTVGGESFTKVLPFPIPFSGMQDIPSEVLHGSAILSQSPMFAWPPIYLESATFYCGVNEEMAVCTVTMID